MDALWLAKRVAALALFIWVIMTSRRAARQAGGTPWKWSSLGVLVFYVSTIAVSVAIIGSFVAFQFTPGVGMGKTARNAFPLVTGGAVFAGLLSGQFALKAALKWLTARSTPPHARPEGMTDT